jgi:hypothetical protein
VQGRIEGAVLDLQNVLLLKASVVVSKSLGRAPLLRGNIEAVRQQGGDDREPGVSSLPSFVRRARSQAIPRITNSGPSLRFHAEDEQIEVGTHVTRVDGVAR